MPSAGTVSEHSDIQLLHLLQCGQRRKKFFAVLGRIHLDVFLHDHALRIDDEGVARSDCVSVHCLNRPIQIDDLLVGIGQELEAQPFLGAELLMRVDRIHADAEDGGVGLFILREIALEVLPLDPPAVKERAYVILFEEAPPAAPTAASP